MTYKNKKIVMYLISFIIIAICITIDMVLKKYTDGVNSSLIPNFISIFSTHNTGGGWSILSDHPILLTVISVIFLLSVIVFYILYKKKNLFFSITISLIVAGAVGNLIDRIFIGKVRDFIKLDFMNFPIFNFADICICVGVFLLCIYLLFIEKRQKEDS